MAIFKFTEARTRELPLGSGIDMAERVGIRCARATYGDGCVNVFEGGAPTVADHKLLWADPEFPPRKDHDERKRRVAAIVAASPEIPGGGAAEVNVSVNTGGVLVVPARQTVEEYLEAKRAAGEIDPDPPMRNVTPGHYTPPEPIEYLPAAPIPGSRGEVVDHTRPAAASADTSHHPTGTRLGRSSTRGD